MNEKKFAQNLNQHFNEMKKQQGCLHRKENEKPKQKKLKLNNLGHHVCRFVSFIMPKKQAH
jgi:hypothetical protein